MDLTIEHTAITIILGSDIGRHAVEPWRGLSAKSKQLRRWAHLAWGNRRRPSDPALIPIPSSQFSFILGVMLAEAYLLVHFVEDILHGYLVFEGRGDVDGRDQEGLDGVLYLIMLAALDLEGFAHATLLGGRQGADDGFEAVDILTGPILNGHILLLLNGLLLLLFNDRLLLLLLLLHVCKRLLETGPDFL